MSAPRPYETDLFSSTKLRSCSMLRSISLYKQNCSTYFFHVVFTMCLETSYICNLRMRSFRTPYFKVQRHFEVIFYLYEYWYELVRDTARHCY